MAASGNTVVLLTNLDPPSTTTSTPNAFQPDSAHQQPAHQLSTMERSHQPGQLMATTLPDQHLQYRRLLLADPRNP
jgi:hypothetical protein